MGTSKYWTDVTDAVSKNAVYSISHVPTIYLQYKQCGSIILFKSNQIKFICDTNQNINEYDIIIRQVCRQDTKAVPTALTGALGSKNTNYNSK